MYINKTPKYLLHWRLMASQIWHQEILEMITNILGEYNAFVFRAEEYIPTSIFRVEEFYPSTLKMETERSSETNINIYHIPEISTLHYTATRHTKSQIPFSHFTRSTSDHTNFMEHSAYWEDNSRSSSQDIICLLRNPKVHCPAHSPI